MAELPRLAHTRNYSPAADSTLTCISSRRRLQAKSPQRFSRKAADEEPEILCFELGPRKTLPVGHCLRLAPARGADNGCHQPAGQHSPDSAQTLAYGFPDRLRTSRHAHAANAG